MVTDAILVVVHTLIKGVVSSLNALIPSPPSWYASPDFSAVTGDIAAAGRWVPVGVVATVGVTIFALMLLVNALKLVRIIASYFTLGGGAL